MVDDALRVAGRARRVEQRERVPLVERPRPRERRVAFGEQRLVADAAEPLAARALRIVDVDDEDIAGANSGSVTTTFASPCARQNASAAASSRTLSAFSTAPSAGTA
jgi:hypothetical protein